MRCCSPGESTLAQSWTSSSRSARCGSATFSSVRFSVWSSMVPSSFGIAHHRTQVAQRDIGHLGQEHRLVGPARPRQRAGRERPQLGKAAQQRGLADARLARDDQCVADLQPQVERVDQLLAVGGADLDVGELDRAVDTRRGRDLRQRPAFLVGGDETRRAG